MSPIQPTFPLTFSETSSTREATLMPCGDKVTEKIALELFKGICPGTNFVLTKGSCPTCALTVKTYGFDDPMISAAQEAGVIQTTPSAQKKRPREEEGEKESESFKKPDNEKGADGERASWDEEAPSSFPSMTQSSSSSSSSSSLSSNLQTSTLASSHAQKSQNGFSLISWAITFSTWEETIGVQLNGQGKITWPDGTICEGLFSNSKLNGKGEKTYKKNDVTFVEKGKFENGLLQEEGIITDSNGNMLQGHFKHGLLHGKGKKALGDSIWEGEFEQGELNGQGTLIGDEGEIYKGQFKNDKLNGLGIKVLDGNEFIGLFKEDCLDGPGSITYDSGIVEKGIFENDELNGPGTRTDPNTGLVEEGIFKEGKLIKSVSLIESSTS